MQNSELGFRVANAKNSFTTLRFAHKENYNKNHCERSGAERSPFCILHFAFSVALFLLAKT